eukprot:GFUD01046925.1.p1 GENE.GFUD01046925.1~~GFUD01046925.1.p1  ORF type:complete len:178 (-),score=14.70 GFUD01046925.1:138-671(-)
MILVQFAILILCTTHFEGAYSKKVRRCKKLNLKLKGDVGDVEELAFGVTCKKVGRKAKWVVNPTTTTTEPGIEVWNGQCVKDNGGNRVLNAGYVALEGVNTPELCIAKCKVLPKCDDMPATPGFNLAGVQFGYQCFCGNAVTPLWLVPNTECGYTCPGNSSEKCGGFNRMNIYPTGL